MVTSLTTILKTTGSSVASAFGVDDNEVVGGGGAGAESGKSVVEQKVDSIVSNHADYPEEEESVHLSLRPQRANLIAKKAPIKVLVKYADFVFSSNLVSELSKHTGINNDIIELVNNHPSHPQVLTSFLTGS